VADETIAGMDSLSGLLESPISALAVCLVLGAIAVSGKFSQHVANILLLMAYGIGAFGIMRSGIKDIRLVGMSLSGLACLAFGISYWLKPPQASPKVQPKAQEEQPGSESGTASDAKPHDSTPEITSKVALHTAKPIDMTLPLVVKAHIYNDGTAEITNKGKVPIKDIQFDYSWHVLDVDYEHLSPQDYAKMTTANVKESGYASGPISISTEVLESGKPAVRYDLKKFVQFKSFPPKTNAPGEWTALLATYFVFRFTFRDTRTEEKYACFKVHGSYLKFPTAVNDDTSTGGLTTVLQFNHAVPEILISNARDHYKDGAKELQCEP
jgi:hypothetical protein